MPEYNSLALTIYPQPEAVQWHKGIIPVPFANKRNRALLQEKAGLKEFNIQACLITAIAIKTTTNLHTGQLKVAYVGNPSAAT